MPKPLFNSFLVLYLFFKKYFFTHYCFSSPVPTYAAIPGCNSGKAMSRL
jgi:hypothetical protein